jgi:hypothetical protein
LIADRRSSDTGFPWGSNEPTWTQRLLVGLVLGCAAAALNYLRAAEHGGMSDFSQLWYGARALIGGRNPYLLIGPHRPIAMPTPLYYPGPAFVAVLPLTLFSVHLAGAIFVFMSTALLAWGSTRNGWHLLPIFPSIAFLTSAQLGQWSILMTAAFFIPAIALVAIAKPQASLPILVSANRLTFYASIAGGLVLLLFSLALFPEWPVAWSQQISVNEYFVPPIARKGGVAIAMVLLRWRRSEAWLVFVAACLPQTWYPYNGLILMLVAANYREACVLSLVSSAMWLIVYAFIPGEMRSPATRELWGTLLVATSYLPAVLVILRRPNEGRGPWWMEMLRTRSSPIQPSP